MPMNEYYTKMVQSSPRTPLVRIPALPQPAGWPVQRYTAPATPLGVMHMTHTVIAIAIVVMVMMVITRPARQQPTLIIILFKTFPPQSAELSQ